MVKQIAINGIVFNVWDLDGPYTLNTVPNDPAWYYIAGADGVNCVSIHFDKTRAVLDKNQADSIFAQIQPVSQEPKPEEIEKKDT